MILNFCKRSLIHSAEFQINPFINADHDPSFCKSQIKKIRSNPNDVFMNRFVLDSENLPVKEPAWRRTPRMAKAGIAVPFFPCIACVHCQHHPPGTPQQRESLTPQTIFKKSAQKLFETIDAVKPDAVICVGQAGGRFDFNVERIAINVDDARIPDNEGKQPIDVKIFEDGENAYFASLPIKAMVEEAKKAGVPASVSNTAGTFVCNHIMYSLLYYINKNKLNIRGGFIHVPYISQQVIGKKNTPYMELTTATKGLEASIRAIKNNLVDVKVTGGKEC